MSSAIRHRTDVDFSRKVRDFAGIFRHARDVAATISQIRFATVLLDNWPTFVALVVCRNAFGQSTTFRLRNHVAFEVPTNEGLPLVRSNLMYMLWENWHDSIYTFPFVDLAPATTVVDCGANIGVFTTYAARRFPEGKVVALEPVHSAFSFLERNLRLNNIDNVLAAQKGLLDLRCVRPMWIHRSNLGGHSALGLDALESNTKAEAEFITLEDVFTDFGLESIDLLKLDIEGAEFRVLKGTKPETFAKIHRIAMEYHLGTDRKIEELPSLLRTLGYSVRTQSASASRGMIWAARRGKEGRGPQSI